MGSHCAGLACADSRDWQPSGKDRRTLLCSDCQAYCKKYGELPPVNAASNNSTRGDTPYLFRPVQTDSPDESPGRMRTRTRAKEQVSYVHCVFVNSGIAVQHMKLFADECFTSLITQFEINRNFVSVCLKRIITMPPCLYYCRRYVDMSGSS